MSNVPSLDDLVQMKNALDKAAVLPSYAVVWDNEIQDYVIIELEKGHVKELLQEESLAQT